MTVLEAAHIVLKEAGKPLHQNEIAERIRRRRLHPLQGKTPGRTVGSVISTDIKNNDASRFVKIAPATFGLRGPSKIRKAVLKVAYTILREVGAPLHQDETAERIRHLWQGLMRGKIPGATVGSAICMDIKNNGDAPHGLERWIPSLFNCTGPPTLLPSPRLLGNHPLLAP